MHPPTRALVPRLLALALAVFALPAYWQAEGSDDAVARHILELTNAARTEHGLAPLLPSAPLTLAAEQYAEQMARGEWFDHVGPDGSTLDQRAEAAGYLGWAALAENLASGHGEIAPVAIMELWLASPAHRGNLLSPDLTEVGVACSFLGDRFSCAQEFGAREP